MPSAFNKTLSSTIMETLDREYVNNNDLHKNCPNSSYSGKSNGSLKSKQILVQFDVFSVKGADFV